MAVMPSSNRRTVGDNDVMTLAKVFFGCSPFQLSEPYCFCNNIESSIKHTCFI